MSTPPVPTTRERILGAAIQLTTDGGWASVTMSRVAQEAGLSRQTIYNEIGSKDDLAEAMLIDELARFLVVVEKAYDSEPLDLPAAVGKVTRDVLTYARDNMLLHAAVSATHGADTELLPLLTTGAGPLLDLAKDLVRVRWQAYDHGLDNTGAETAIDVLTRAVLSHVMQPTDTPEATGDSLMWTTRRLLGA